MRSERLIRLAPQRHALGARSRERLRRQPSARGHRPQNPLLARPRGVGALPRIEAARLLRERREKRGLGRRERRDVATEVRPRGAAGADDLIPIRRQVEIERENLALGVAVLEAQRHHRLAPLLDQAATGQAAVLLREQQLRHLLRDRRSALHDAPRPQVGERGAPDRDRVDADVREEPEVLGRERRMHQHVRQIRRGQQLAARAVGAAHFIQDLAVPVDHHRRSARVEIDADPRAADRAAATAPTPRPPRRSSASVGRSLPRAFSQPAPCD